MALKDVLQQWLDEAEWEDEIRHDDDDDTDFVSTSIEIGGQGYRLLLINDEARQTVRVSLFSPIKIPQHRAKEAACVLNFLNVHIAFGNFEMNDGGIVY